MERSASMPWPISRRPGPRLGLHSPTRVAGEVVVQVEALLVLVLQAVDGLDVLDGAQGGGDQGLGLAPGEQAGAVGGGQHAHFDVQGADLVELAAVQPGALLEDGVAEEGLLEQVEAFDHVLLQFRACSAASSATASFFRASMVL